MRQNKYFNQLQVASSLVQTLCHIRLQNNKEASAKEKMANINTAGSRVSLLNKLGIQTDYEFNYTFRPNIADLLVLDKA